MSSSLLWLLALLCVCTTFGCIFLLGVIARLYDRLAVSRAELKDLQQRLIENDMAIWNKALGGKQFLVLKKPNRWKEKVD